LVANKKRQVAEWSPSVWILPPNTGVLGTESVHPLLPLPVGVLGALDLEYSCATQQKGVPTPCEERQGG